MINSINLDKLNKSENSNKIAKAGEEGGFENALNDSLKELNKVQINADKAIADLATGEVKDLHQAAIAIAETSMKLMLEIRNKALSAYKEISRTQI